MLENCINDQYDNECPDCGTPLMAPVGAGETCANCDHVFWDASAVEAGVLDPSLHQEKPRQ